MKYIITESRLNNLVLSYLDSQNWDKRDAKNGGFDVSNNSNGEPIFRYRTRFSRLDTKDNIYISEDFGRQIIHLFNLDMGPAVKLILEWFNKKYDTNLGWDDTYWMETYDMFDYDDNDDEFYYDDDEY